MAARNSSAFRTPSRPLAPCVGARQSPKAMVRRPRRRRLRLLLFPTPPPAAHGTATTLKTGAKTACTSTSTRRPGRLKNLCPSCSGSTVAQNRRLPSGDLYTEGTLTAHGVSSSPSTIVSASSGSSLIPNSPASPRTKRRRLWADRPDPCPQWVHEKLPASPAIPKTSRSSASPPGRSTWGC